MYFGAPTFLWRHDFTVHYDLHEQGWLRRPMQGQRFFPGNTSLVSLWWEPFTVIHSAIVRDPRFTVRITSFVQKKGIYSSIQSYLKVVSLLSVSSLGHPTSFPFYCFFFFFNPHLRICFLILERGVNREGGRERKRETSMWERNIDQLPPVCALTGEQTHNLLVFGTMLQPTEPPARALLFLIIPH